MRAGRGVLAGSGAEGAGGGGEAGPGGLLNPGHPSGEKMGVKVRELENRGIKLGNRE